MKRPEVSIIMPTFNRLPWLRAAVDSVLAQTYRDWELILADDGSDLPTQAHLRALASARAPRVRVLFRRHCGNPPAVRNAALREAAGEFVAFLDSDDLWRPQKLERQLASLRERPQREWSYTGATLIDGSGRPIVGRSLPRGEVTDGWIAESLLRGNAAVAQSSVLVRREAIERVGGYPEDLPVCGDYELFVRLALRSEVDYLDEDLVLIRRHGEYYSGDIAALRDLYRFIRRVQRAQLAPAMAGVLRIRRARVALNMARACLRLLAPAWVKALVRAGLARRAA